MNAQANPSQVSRRQLGSLSLGAAALLAGLQSPAALAEMRVPTEGTDYIKLDKPAATEGIKGKIEVVEFFWYHCPHCNHFEPTLEAWLKNLPKDVSFKRVPVAFRPNFVPDQQLFFALEAMGLLGKLHKLAFAAIHAERLPLDSREQIIEWVAKQGVDKTKFIATYDGFAVGSKTTRATQLQQAYNVTGVPALGIAGQFYTDGSLAQSMAGALQVTDYLINQLRSKSSPAPLKK